MELSRGVKSRTEIIQRKLDHLKGPYYAYFILLIMFIFLKLHLQTLMFKTHVIFLIQQHHIHPLSKTFTPLSPSACYPVLIGQLNHSVVIGQLLSVSVGDGTPPTVTRFHLPEAGWKAETTVASVIHQGIAVKNKASPQHNNTVPSQILLKGMPTSPKTCIIHSVT